MTSDKGIRQQDERIWHFDVLVADEFIMTEVGLVVDALRIANRVTARPRFQWRFRSAKGGDVQSLSGGILRTETFLEKPDADYAFVIGNSNQDNPALSLMPVISRYTFRGAQVFLLAEAASRYIRERGGAAQGMSTHWENSALSRERMDPFDADTAIASENGPVVTCAGMGATLDVMLAVMRRHIPSAAVMMVANIFLHENIRDFQTRQPFGGARGTTTGDAELDHCIELMQANIEEPLPIADLVDAIGLSNRSLERKFRAHLSTTPNTFYRELRLAKANNLLLNTSMPVREVGLACGFSSGFSGLYKSFFGITPAAMRKGRRKGAL